MEFLITILIFLFVIGVLILAHEWGHFIAAKKIGIQVEAFSIGFGPKLFSWTRNGTEYRLSILPLGGYVKMLSENPEEGITGDPREFQSRKRWERFIVLFMGPLLNVVLAYVIWTGTIMAGEQKEEWLTKPPLVHYVMPGGPAQKAGILRGDLIKEVSGEPMKTWEQLVYKVATSPREELHITVSREGSDRTFAIKPYEDPQRGIGSIGVSPGYPPVIEGLEKGMPADQAGLKNDDVVLSVNGRPVENYYDIRDMVLNRRSFVTNRNYESVPSSGDNPKIDKYLQAAWERFAEIQQNLRMEVKRGEETFTVTVIPQYDPRLGILRIGIAAPSMPKITVSRGPIEAFVMAGERSVNMTMRLYDILAKMITGQLSSKAISGPVEIAAISKQSADQGIIPFLNLMAFISLNLGIVNLLPLPVLDGGQITVLAIEGVIRRDLSQPVKEWIMRIGVMLLFLLMALVISQDIGKLMSRMG